MDINLKKYITVTDDELLLGSSSEIVRASDVNTTRELLETVNLPTDTLVLGKIKRIDMIPFVVNNIPNFIFDIRAYFDRGMPEEVQANMTIWFQELNETTQEMETFSYNLFVLLTNSEFILDLSSIQDKLIKIDFRMGTKFYNTQDHFFKTVDFQKISNSLYLYDYQVQEVPIPIYQLNSPTSLPPHLRDKTTQLQETINVFRVPNINKVPLIELAEKIYIYDVPWTPALEIASLDSTLVPEFRAGITKYLNNTLKGTLGEEQIFIRYPVDETRTSFRYFVFINTTFYEVTANQEVVSSAYQVLSSMTAIPLLDWVPTVFSKEKDIYSIDMNSMHLCYIKYRTLTIADLGVRYSQSHACIARPIHAGELTYTPPPLNLAGTTWSTDGSTNIITGTMGDVYYYAAQIN